jgi:uncharacterized protein (DUF58 family)
MFRIQPAAFTTNLNKAINTAMGIIKRKSIIVIVSDFVDTGYEANLKALARKHDLILIHVASEREGQLPAMGIVPFYDKERQATLWVNSSSSRFRNQINANFYQKREELEKLCLQHKANYLFVNVEEDYVPRLVRLFRVRNLTRK